MKDKIKVGDVWALNSDTKITARVTAIGETRLLALKTYPYMEVYEDDYLIESFLKNYTLKKPEPKLKKLVAWVCPEGSIADVDFEDSEHNENWTKKEIIIKDGALYVEE